MEPRELSGTRELSVQHLGQRDRRIQGRWEKLISHCCCVQRHWVQLATEQHWFTALQRLSLSLLGLMCLLLLGNAPTGMRHVPRSPWIGLDFYITFYSHSFSFQWVMNFISYSETTPSLGKGAHQYLLLCSRVGAAPQGNTPYSSYIALRDLFAPLPQIHSSPPI